MDERAIIAGQTAESMHVSDTGGGRPCSDRCYFIRITLDAIATHNVSKEGNLALEQAAFRRFQFQSIAVKPVKDSGEAIEMLVKGLRKDEYVVQIYETHVIRQARHYQFHDACELARSIGKTEAKNLKAPLPFSHDKSSLVTVVLIYLGLPVTPTEVTSREEFASVQGI